MSLERHTEREAELLLTEMLLFEAEVWAVLRERLDGTVEDAQALDRLSMLMYAHQFTVREIFNIEEEDPI